MKILPKRKRVSKDLLLFSGLALLLTVVTGAFLYKFLPVLVQQQIYECQAFVSSFTVKIFTCHLQITLLVLGSLILSIIGIRIGLVLFRIARLRRKIVKNAFRLKRYSHIRPLLKRFQLEKAFVLVEDEQPYAFCFGVIRQHMYISTGLVVSMNEQELIAVLLHERYHLEQKDSLTMLIASLIQVLFPFFPVIADLFTRYRIECETRADQAAIEQLHSHQPLLTVLKKMLSVPSRSSLAFAPLADRTLEPRIRRLVSQESNPAKMSFLRLGISFFSLLLLCLMILTPTGSSTSVTVADTGVHTTGHLCLSGNSCALSCTRDNSLVFSFEEAFLRKNS